MYRVGQKDVRQGVSDDDKTLCYAARRPGSTAFWGSLCVAGNCRLLAVCIITNKDTVMKHGMNI